LSSFTFGLPSLRKRGESSSTATLKKPPAFLKAARSDAFKPE